MQEEITGLTPSRPRFNGALQSNWNNWKEWFPEGEVRGPELLPRGANPHTIRADIMEADAKLHKRMTMINGTRVNIVAVLLAVFVPWLAIIGMFATVSFGLHYKAPMQMLLICLLAVWVVYQIAHSAWTARKTGQDYFFKAYIAIVLIIVVPMTWLAADYNFWTYLQPAYEVEHLARYEKINPSQTQRLGRTWPTNGKRYQDAGAVTFADNVVLDQRRSVGFKMGALYCVAPIIDKTCKKNCGQDFWAVGIDCCSEDASNFRCGDFNNTRARGGLRMMRDHQRHFFRLAVLQAEGVFGFVSTHPLFFYWDENPEEEIVTMKRTGMKLFFMLMLVSLPIFIGAIMVTLKYFAIPNAKDHLRREHALQL